MEEREVEILAETQDFSVWRMEEPDGELVYHLEFGNLTVHFLHEDWEQFLELVSQLRTS